MIYRINKNTPNNIRKIFDNFKKNIKNIKKVCKGKLNKFYIDIQNQLNSSKTKYIFVKNNKEIVGFMILSKSMFKPTIEYLCSNTRGVGTKLIRQAENYVIENDATKLALIADKDAVGFYKKKGFKMIDEEVLLMEKEIKSKIQREQLSVLEDEIKNLKL